MTRVLTGEDVADVLADLVLGDRSREEVTQWALALMRLQDEGALVYAPPQAEEAIWHAIEFLLGADLKESADEYFHELEEFEEYLLANRSRWLL